ncbi:MAG TPA: hypothetical protein VKZ53_18535 [Candidatus Angelobacter sp.]|nr:hypothetical protein [Candidatus Angelobacter sp.]
MKKSISVLMAFLLVSTLCIPVAGCSGLTADAVLTDLPIATDIALSVVTIVGPSNEAYVAAVKEYSGKVAADLRLMKTLVDQYKASLVAAPSGTLTQINTALVDAQTNLTAILQAVGVSNPRTTAAVAAAVASVKLILGDVALLVKRSSPEALNAQVFFGIGMPGADFLAMVPVDGNGRSAKPGSEQAKLKPSGRSARQIAREYNQKIGKDFPAARVDVPKMKVMGIAIPLTGSK